MRQPLALTPAPRRTEACHCGGPPGIQQYALPGLPKRWMSNRVKLSAMNAPETRYVAVGDADVAYQVVGDGPLDLLLCYGLGGHVDLFWTDVWSARPLTQLASFSRLILFDRRGTGASDPVARNAMPTWEELTADMEAVLGAVGSKTAAIVATLDTGPIAILFAAMHPERVRALVLRNTTARFLEADDYPIGMPSPVADAVVETLATMWGTEEFSRLTNPSHADNPEYTRWQAMMNRASATPRTVAAQYEYLFHNLDVRHVLPLIQAPTLILHVEDSPLFSIEYGRYLAEHIAGATLIEVPGSDLGEPDDETNALVIEFLTGDRPEIEVDRILTTVLFTDIVGSTERAATIGDKKWRNLLDAHDHAVRGQLHRFRGREINTTGDGFVASFDGPARAIRCARAIGEATTNLGVQLRQGLHTGECEVRGDDLGGLAVHVAARVAALASAGEIMASSMVKELVAGSGIEFDDRGEYELKGVPGTWRLFAVGG
jgi:class 3 adenylate cyclase